MSIFNGMRVLAVSALVVLLDQVTKIVVKNNFFLGESVEVFGQTFRFTYIENAGMAFGIQIGRDGSFLTIFATFATAVIIFYLYRIRHERLASRLSLALILGGAIGNLIDRYAYGQVIDFIDVGVGNTRWPVFNLADSGVTVGMVILIFLLLFEKNQAPSVVEAPAFPEQAPTPSDESDNWRGTRQ